MSVWGRRRALDPSAHPCILIVEQDADIRELLGLILSDAGYHPLLATSPQEAVGLHAHHNVDLVLTNLFGPDPADLLAAVCRLQDAITPTPLAVLASWPLTAEMEECGFAFLMAMPFDIDDLLLQIAVCLAQPLSPVQAQQAVVVALYFAALTAHDWTTLVALCTEDVLYLLPSSTQTPYTASVQGQDALWRYAHDTFAQFPQAEFVLHRIAACPLGLVGAYRSSWAAPDGTQMQQEGAVVFRFDGERISQIGVSLNAQRLNELMRLHGATS